MNGSGESRGCSGWLHCRVGGFELNLDWDVAPGRALVLFGPSGAGKTTALKAMAGLVRPLAGKVQIDGIPVYDSARNVSLAPHRRRIGYLTQQYHLFPHLNVMRNVAYGLQQGGGNATRNRTMELLENFELRGLELRYPWELSGGQQQRVALARALATEPRALLLDEPFAALDLGLRRTVRQELRTMLSRNPVPVILVTHDREEALALGDEVQVIDGGQTIARGIPIEVLGQPGQAAVARLVGVENLLRMRVASRQPRDGTMRLSMLGRGRTLFLETPLDTGPADPHNNEWVTVGIRASDIILSSRDPVGSSARNRLPGTVVRIEPRPPGYTVELDCGVPLHCHVTGASLEEMEIRVGHQLWAVFKASSCFLVDGDTEG